MTVIDQEELALRLMGDTSVKDVQGDTDWATAFTFALDEEHSGDYTSPNTGPIMDVVRVIAKADGTNDEEAWLGVFKMKSGKFIVIRASCCYTGFDACGSGTYEEFDTVEEACSKLSLVSGERARLVTQLRGRVTLDW